MNKAVFLDRDGTIIVDKGYSFLPESIQFLDGAIAGLKLLKKHGFLLIVISNQSGIARGYFTETQLQVFNNAMCEQLERFGVQIDAIYCCPHHPQGNITKYSIECNCRKPKIGLFKTAVQDFDIDLSKSYAIGDRLTDCSICDESLCKGCLIKSELYDIGETKIPTFDTFLQCVEYILR